MHTKTGLLPREQGLHVLVDDVVVLLLPLFEGVLVDGLEHVCGGMAHSFLRIFVRNPLCQHDRSIGVAEIVEELGGEKIDIIEYSEEPEKFIAAALSPAKVVSVEVDPDGAKACRVTVPDAQLSLAIGNKGQNARLAAKLTGWKIDIRPESGFYGEDEE